MILTFDNFEIWIGQLDELAFSQHGFSNFSNEYNRNVWLENCSGMTPQQAVNEYINYSL